jgi:hypothetical protein
LCEIVCHSAELLRSLAYLAMERVLSSSVINTYDTEVTLLTLGDGKGSRKARLWIYRSNEVRAQYDVFAFTDSRSRAAPDGFLKNFHRTICGDCYSGYVTDASRSRRAMRMRGVTFSLLASSTRK